MNEFKQTLIGILIGFAIYAPAAIYFFDTSLSTMLERAYFTIGGAAIALYARRRAAVSGAGGKDNG